MARVEDSRANAGLSDTNRATVADRLGFRAPSAAPKLFTRLVMPPVHQYACSRY